MLGKLTEALRATAGASQMPTRLQSRLLVLRQVLSGTVVSETKRLDLKTFWVFFRAVFQVLTIQCLSPGYFLAC